MAHLDWDGGRDMTVCLSMATWKGKTFLHICGEKNIKVHYSNIVHTHTAYMYMHIIIHIPTIIHTRPLQTIK